MWYILIFSIFVSLIIFIIWMDWIFQCKKIARDNKLDFYAVGYAIVKGTGEKQTVLFVEGLLGANSNELVFGSRFQDEAVYLTEELSHVCRFHLSDYQEHDFLNFVRNIFDGKNVEPGYVIRNMGGLSTSKHIPKFIKTRMLCNIGYEDNDYFYFCYKNTARNAEAIEHLKKRIQEETSQTN